MRLTGACLICIVFLLVCAPIAASLAAPEPYMSFMCGYCGSAGPGQGIQMRCFNEDRTFEVRQGCNDDCSNCTTVERHGYGATVHNKDGTFTAANNTFPCEGVAYLRYFNRTCNDYPLANPRYRDGLASGQCRSDFRLTCNGDGVDVSNCTTGAALPYNQNSCFVVDNQNSKVQCLGSGYCFQIYKED